MTQVAITRAPDQFRPGVTHGVATPTCCSCCCCCVGTAVGFTVAVPLAVARLSPDPARPAPTRAGRPWGLGLVALAPLLGALVAITAHELLSDLLTVAGRIALLLGGAVWVGCLAAGLRLCRARPRAVGVAILLLVLAALVAVVELNLSGPLFDSDEATGTGRYVLAAAACFVTMVTLGWLLSWDRSPRVPPDGAGGPGGAPGTSGPAAPGGSAGPGGPAGTNRAAGPGGPAGAP